MGRHTVYLVGESMFAESLFLLLTDGEEASSISRFTTLKKVQPKLQSQPPDILILVDQDISDLDFAANLEEMWPDLPVIWANIKNDFLRLIPSRRLPPTREGLLQAIESMAVSK